MACEDLAPVLIHRGLNTTFNGSVNRRSTTDAQIHQYLGIKYASIPARFRQSHLCAAGSYPSETDASKYGPICPQLRKSRTPDELLFGIPLDEIPTQSLKQDEFECLNLNITRPAGLTQDSHVPVMLWIHGGGDAGSGSEWYYDGGAIVRKSILDNKPIIFVSINFRLGLLGFAASNIIRDDNKSVGDEGAGNYGLRDQRRAMEWLHHHIGDFGGDASNITVIGSGSGAADIVCHLLSKSNISKPLFARTIIQSPIFEPILQDVSSAGWHLSRVMSALQASNIDKFRKIEVEKLLGLGQSLRAVDDGVWFREGWQSWFSPKESAHEHHHTRESRMQHPSPTWQRPGRAGGMGVCSSGILSPIFAASRDKSRSRSGVRGASSHTPSTPLSPTSAASTTPPLQPIMIGDCAADSLLWSLPISLWTASGVVRRLKAVCQSLSKTSGILRAYDIGSGTSDEEIFDRVLELVDDARIKWPTDMFAEAILRDAEEKGGENAKKGRIWRYVFDQEGPARGLPHHGSDLMYLFDWRPASLGLGALGSTESQSTPGPDMFWDGPFDVDEDDEEVEKAVVSHQPPSLSSLSLEAALAVAAEAAAAAAIGTAPKIDPHTLASSIVSSGGLSAASRNSSGSTLASNLAPISEDSEWLITAVDRYSYARVRDTMQEKWLSFAHGESPWTSWTGHKHDEPQTPHHQPHSMDSPTTPSALHTHFNTSLSIRNPEKVFVFGPEGETGERTGAIFEGRRRRTVWAEVLAPLGWNLVQKFGVELSRGPAGADRAR
ncbi:Alpha/Beta hydrolase protein [Crepidotus variabilis]|uniref:Alpha/Beta hydrolase protein n=1 Tax=Crepidotus variabilis TaxID=179855 RepID=A0A9P6EEK3_9AGAR|nr:Alpha/Beta hydrolase protein [Crepidotus variabilis]